MGEYQITFNSKTVMTTQTYEADTIGEAIDEALALEQRWDGPATYLEISILNNED